MTITQLEYVLAVNKHRHFGKAAEACHVTQPTLSMQIQKLEDELKVILFDRSKSPIVPTLEGEALIAQSQNVMREYHKMFSILDMESKSLKGDLYLGVIPTLSPYLIPLFAKSFCTKNPEVNLHIEELQTAEILRRLDRDELDVGLLVTPLRQPSLVEKVLFYEPFHLFASSEHPLASKEKVREKDLKGKDLWLLPEGHCMRSQMMAICELNRNEEGPIKNLHFESGNLETLMEMVDGSGGYTLIPHLALRKLSPKYKKQVRSFSTPVPTREVSLVFGRLFYKERLIESLEREILLNIPREVSSHKNRQVSVIDIVPE
jgi:LysR family transcriptional regulator, hydrogen peroxide-inducible genes activator